MTGGTPTAFRVVGGWEQLPQGFVHADVADVGVDSRDRVYLLTRRDPRVIVYESDGRFHTSWGESVLSAMPHGLTVGPDDTVYVLDELRNTVEAYTSDGRLLFPVGPSGCPPADTGADPTIRDIHDRIATIRRSAGPYNRPTKLAVAPSGDLYVADGYANARIHRFDAEGRLISSWGEPGTGPGQFHLPHGLIVLPDERVVVCDRENDRLQVFAPDGAHLATWPGFHRPAAVAHRQGVLYVTEHGWRVGHRTWMHGTVRVPEPARLTLLDTAGRILDRWGSPRPCEPDGLTAPHGLAVDSRGDVYIAEVTWNSGGRSGRFSPDCHTFVKLTARVHG